ncbi:hypothetical protein LTS08_001879 [Lithohypha guttulata]|nr:hypothetical protein LTS08_001879 [Lithohypha guttulata]
MLTPASRSWDGERCSRMERRLQCSKPSTLSLQSLDSDWTNMATILVSDLPRDATIAADRIRSLVWIGDATGNFASLDLADAASGVHQHQNVGFAIRALAVGQKVLVVVGIDGQILLLNPDLPTDTGNDLGLLLAKPRQAVLNSAGTFVYVVAGATDTGPSGGTLIEIELTLDQGHRRQEYAVPGISGVTEMAGSIWVACNTAEDYSRGQVYNLNAGNLVLLLGNLPLISRIGALLSTDTIVAVHPNLNVLSLIDTASSGTRTVQIDGILDNTLEVAGISDTTFVATTNSSLILIPTTSIITSSPFIEPVKPIFVGSWTRLFFNLGDTGLDTDQIHFGVSEPRAAFVSFTTESDKDEPVPLLIVGGRTGGYEISMMETATNRVLATQKFSISDEWLDDINGPPGTYFTDTLPRGESSWGGGPNSPQNLNTNPHTGTWNLLVILVDTSSARWPDEEIDSAKENILKNITTGVDVGAKSYSVKKYYEENSANQLTISVHKDTAFGVLNLPNAWEDYFAQTKDKDDNVTDDRWWNKNGSVRQIIVTAANQNNIVTTEDLQAVDTVVFFVFPADTDFVAGARFAWPVQWDSSEYSVGDWFWQKANFSQIYMTSDWESRDGRKIYATLSHEVGHSLGLPDLYEKPEYASETVKRIVYDWDMMAGSRDHLPHFSLSNKMRMGWVNASALKLFNFQVSGAVSETVILRAAEVGTVATNQSRGIEIRLADGWNLYIEYRAEQIGFISDDLIHDQRVMITDVVCTSFRPVSSRPVILFVRDDPATPGIDEHLLARNDSLIQIEPATQMRLAAKVLSTDTNTAQVQVTYSSGQRPEPGIRDWEGSKSNWQSPDIEVRNERSLAKPDRYYNVPWLGHRNQIVAKIRNSGDLQATGVTVDFFVTRFTTGDGPETPMGSATGDILPSSTTEFIASEEWSPPEDGHYCMIVRIRQYQDPADPLILDRNPYNQVARSNYTSFISASQSPSSRVNTTINLSNPFPQRSIVFARVTKQHRYHRVFTSHQWRRVSGKSQLPIKVWDESIFGTPEWDALEQKDEGLLYKLPNQVSVEGHVTRVIPEIPHITRSITGGVGIRIDAGRATRIDIRDINRAAVAGSVFYLDSGRRLGGGGIVLFEIYPSRGGDYIVGDDTLNSDGFFAFKFARVDAEPAKAVVVHYLGDFDAAPSTTRVLQTRSARL